MSDLFRKFQLIPEFVSKMTHGEGYRWGLQVRENGGKTEYYEQLVKTDNRKSPKRLTENDWHNHFEGKPVTINKVKKIVAGSMSLVASFDGHCKFFCLDCDNIDAVETARDKIIPVLEGMGIDFIWEHSGTDEEPRAHLWFLVDCPLSLLQALVKQIFEDAGVNPHDQKCQFELYPTGKPNSMIRFPGGFHMKNGQVNSVTYRGKTSNDVVFILESFINATQMSEAEVRLRVRPREKRPERERRKIRGPKSYFYYTPLDLPLPETAQEYPRVLKKVASECQAVNTLLNRSVEENFLSKHGGLVHLWGLYLWNLALYNDLIRRKQFAPEGEKWAEHFLKKYRTRDWNSHNWNYNKKEYESNPERLFPKCETWDRDFGLCDGCPFKKNGRIRSPKTLYYGVRIERESLRRMRLVDADTIRKTTFPTVKRRVISLINAHHSTHPINKRILVASPQGSGKSVMTDELAVELAAKGYNVLISAPTGKLQLEHRDRIRELGGEAFVLKSHRNHFKLELPEFKECPYFDEIQDYIKYGVSSRVFKQKFCDNCQFREACPYPDQYTAAKEPENRIVIITHAHFAATEAMHAILEKEFDVLFIDEAVVDNVISEVKPVEVEWTLLRQIESVEWTARLADWLEKGGKPQGKKIRQTVQEMQTVEKVFLAYGAPWRVPEYVRFFNNQAFLDTSVGLHVFHPLPTDKVPITVITDATPPKEMYQILFDDPDIEVYGDDEILDFRKMNVNNRVVQVLDTSMSKTSMRGPLNEDGEYDYERMVEWLEFIGDKARHEYKDKKILITTYKSFEEVAKAWLESNYPDVVSRILVSHMAIGTNEFEDCDVQFLLAGVYLSTKDFHDNVYKLKTIANYWNQKHERPTIPNFFYSHVGQDASIERITEPVYRVQPVKNHAYVFKYPQFYYRPPLDMYYALVERFMIAKTQQSLRLRYNNDKEKVTYISGNYFLSTFLITDSVLEEELLGYLRVVDDE